MHDENKNDLEKLHSRRQVLNHTWQCIPLTATLFWEKMPPEKASSGITNTTKSAYHTCSAAKGLPEPSCLSHPSIAAEVAILASSCKHMCNNEVRPAAKGSITLG